LWHTNDLLSQMDCHDHSSDDEFSNVGTDGYLDRHTGRISGITKSTKKFPKFFNPFKDYFWDGHTMGMDGEW
jgi:hypothetical protein